MGCLARVWYIWTWFVEMLDIWDKTQYTCTNMMDINRLLDSREAGKAGHDPNAYEQFSSLTFLSFNSCYEGYNLICRIVQAFFELPAGLLGPSTARSTCPAMPSLLASNWLPITPSLLNGPPTAWPICPMAPSGLNCLPIAPAEEMTEGFCVTQLGKVK